MKLMLDATVRRTLDLFREQVEPNTAISTGVDYTEVAALPAVVLEDLQLRENRKYRHIVFEHKLRGANAPDKYFALRRLRARYYDLMFRATLLTDSMHQLMTGMERLVQFVNRNPYVLVTDPDGEEDVELTLETTEPVGEYQWPANRSDVQSMSARFKLSALPIYDGNVTEVPLVLHREFIFKHTVGRLGQETVIVLHTE